MNAPFLHLSIDFDNSKAHSKKCDTSLLLLVVGESIMIKIKDSSLYERVDGDVIQKSCSRITRRRIQ